MQLSQRAISWILAIHLVLCWTAVLLRIDRFPLTWAPMYSVYQSKAAAPEYRTPHKDRKILETQGWKATHRDGTESWVSRSAINVQKRSMWRLFYQRTKGKGPPKQKQLNYDAGTIDRWLWGLEPGEPFEAVNWRRRLLESVNKTLGYEPGDSKFIVKLAANSEEFVFDGDSYDYLETRPQSHQAVWEDPWAEDFQ